jgi:hypothetical protein
MIRLFTKVSGEPGPGQQAVFVRRSRRRGRPSRGPGLPRRRHAAVRRPRRLDRHGDARGHPHPRGDAHPAAGDRRLGLGRSLWSSHPHGPGILVPFVDAPALRFSAGADVVALGDADLRSTSHLRANSEPRRPTDFSDNSASPARRATPQSSYTRHPLSPRTRRTTRVGLEAGGLLAHGNGSTARTVEQVSPRRSRRTSYSPRACPPSGTMTSDRAGARCALPCKPHCAGRE